MHLWDPEMYSSGDLWNIVIGLMHVDREYCREKASSLAISQEALQCATPGL